MPFWGKKDEGQFSHHEPSLCGVHIHPVLFLNQQFIDKRREASTAVFQNFECKQRGEAKIAAKLQCNAMIPDASQIYRIKSESHDA